ncbi:MAG: hypothetical protein R2705_25155 [Ilumatobacteraceae bacterium]
MIVVDVPTELQVERLISFRGFDEADAQRGSRSDRREQRLAIADRVIDNTGDRAALSPQVDGLEVVDRPPAAPNRATIQRPPARRHRRDRMSRPADR